VHASSFDTWRERGSFALGASGGAPPDLFFSDGQDWGFPPLHPEGIRNDRHRYPIACLRRIADRAGSIRIDHVMGLHRLYWVPHGFPAGEGAYVTYPTDELYAILCLEAHRHGTMVAGEDLGTVPEAVREMMTRRGIRRSYVVQFSLKADADEPVEPPPPASLASANTHDMPPFAAYWRDAEPALRRAVTGYLAERGRLAAAESPDATAVLLALLADVAASDAETLLVTLEDLWGETEPQNVPGTSGPDAENWRRRARHGLEELLSRAELVDALRRIDTIRSASASGSEER
jgi:4-alpha-glucanotransferase